MLKQQGWQVVIVPYYEWNHEQRGRPNEYLQKKINAAIAQHYREKGDAASNGHS